MKLNKKNSSSKPDPVIVAFKDDDKAGKADGFDLKKFSFGKAKKILKNYTGSLSDAVIEERRSAT
ncbi:MAG: hypothetical protein JW832_06660 [Deltaproteobacteria bacterium]|nr:hypothetical protein [Deltaproteobacteria bacterium]